MKTTSSIDQRILFSVVAFTIGLAFKLTFIFTAGALDGYCLYTFWRPEPFGFLSPFWLFNFAIFGLLIWASLGFYWSITRIKTHKLSLAFYLCAIAILITWLRVMYYFWFTFEVELGNASFEAISQSGGFFSMREPFQCKSI